MAFSDEVDFATGRTPVAGDDSIAMVGIPPACGLLSLLSKHLRRCLHSRTVRTACDTAGYDALTKLSQGVRKVTESELELS